MDIKLKELSKIGYINDKARSIALQIIKKHFKHSNKQEIINILIDIKNNPEKYYEHEYLKILAEIFGEKQTEINYKTYELEEKEKTYKCYGSKNIESSAKKQMEIAMSLPIVKKGALMPDAHTGYGMPIGGVLATKNAIIPYAIGVDIGCRMALTIYDETDAFINRNSFLLKQSLKNNTHFGMEGGLDKILENEIMDRKEFQDFEILKKLKSKAYRQLGSSGSGNHFVEFGVVEIFENNNLNIAPKKYVAILSHSGSRGLGATIAQEYIKIAMDICRLPREAKSLAWLDMNSDEGKEYWALMNFAGDYAKACHDNIHQSISKSIGLDAISKIENHHNFAWKEKYDELGEVIVHRKGATPAHENELGIIPSNMVSPAYIVKGKGISESLNSASHGSGRAMSRQKAKEMNTQSSLKKMLLQNQVHLIGGSVEEAPNAYKEIDSVMRAQSDLVESIGMFMPKIVRMNKE